MRILMLLGLAALMAVPFARAQDSNEVAVVTGMNQFAFDVYGRVSEGGRNVFFSPYSLSSALAMTTAGARGLTATQMAEVLRFTVEPELLHPACGRVLRRLNEGAVGYELRVANRLWAQSGFDLLDSYLGLTRDEYDAEVTPVDFRARAETVRVAINRWVEDHTANRIRDLLKPGVVGDSTRLLLVNAIYFKGKWRHAFSRNLSQPEPFKLADGKELMVPMMHQTKELRYAEDDALQLLELPYGEGALSMVIFLPRTADGLSAMEKSLSAETLGGRLASMEKRDVQVYLPRFELTQEFELGKTLKAMGMTEAFAASADFSGITGGRDLFISAVVHKAFVDVNEEGTEAAAATGVVMRPTSVMPRHPPAVFRADHPFIFLIRDSRSGAILFMGRVANPA